MTSSRLAADGPPLPTLAASQLTSRFTPKAQKLLRPPSGTDPAAVTEMISGFVLTGPSLGFLKVHVKDLKMVCLLYTEQPSCFWEESGATSAS